MATQPQPAAADNDSEIERQNPEVCNVVAAVEQMVIIEGFDATTDVEALASELKSALGTGGTVEDGRIEIQGDHEARIRELLEERGYRVED